MATTDVMASIVGIFYFVTLGTQPGDWLRLSALSITKLEEARAWLNGKLGRGEIRLE